MILEFEVSRQQMSNNQTRRYGGGSCQDSDKTTSEFGQQEFSLRMIIKQSAIMCYFIYIFF